LTWAIGFEAQRRPSASRRQNVVTIVEGRQRFATLNNMPNSDLTVTATDARRSFLKLLRLAQDGARVTITWRGKPVAELKAPHSARS